MKTFIHKYNNREFQILVGQNATENLNLIDIANSNDMWFHVEGHPSGHVILKEITSNKNIKNVDYPYKLLLEGARYCKSQSKLKNERCKIVYTTINNISKGKDIGSVIIKNEKYISI